MTKKVTHAMSKSEKVINDVNKSDPNLDYLELLAKAKPGEEADRGRVNWGKQKPIIPEKAEDQHG